MITRANIVAIVIKTWCRNALYCMTTVGGFGEKTCGNQIPNITYVSYIAFPDNLSRAVSGMLF
jgi:hypothetical protein